MKESGIEDLWAESRLYGSGITKKIIMALISTELLRTSYLKSFR